MARGTHYGSHYWNWNKIGFSYMPHVEDDEAFLQQFSRLPLFARGKNQDVWNIMKGHVQDFEVTIMEFRYSYNSSSTKSTGEISTQTVVILESDTLNLPSFSLTDKTSTELGKKIFSALVPTFTQFHLRTLTLIPFLYFRNFISYREQERMRTLFESYSIVM